MKKFLILSILTAICSLTLSAKGEYDDQLKQLADEIAAATVGTSDSTFESCTFSDGMITFVVNPKSKIGQARLADPFAEKFYETILMKMFGGNPAQGIQIMDFLMGARTNFCFKIRPAGQTDFMETTIWPGDVKPMLQELLAQ